MRSSVILHEIAHLIGLDGDEEQDSLDSAECLRNFTLLVCEIVKPEDLFIGDEEENDENAKLKGEDGELPHNPNHHPAGNPQGGQFAPKEGGSDSGSGSSEFPKKESTAKSESPKSEPGSKSSESNSDSKNSDRKENNWDKINSKKMLFPEEKEEYIKTAEEILSGEKDSYINIPKGEIQRKGDKLWSAFNGMFNSLLNDAAGKLSEKCFGINVTASLAETYFAFVDLTKFIICFDDLERAKLPMQELLG